MEELGLKDFESKPSFAKALEGAGGLWSVVNLSEAQKANRIDAEYFQSKYQKILSLIRGNGGIALGELAMVKKGFEPGSEAYQEEGKLFIRVSSVSKDGITDKDQKYLKDELYSELKKEYQPKVGEILLTKDASPGIAYAVKEQIEGIISGGVLRVKLKEDIEPEYCALVINSIVGQLQVERDAGGSIIAHWKLDQVKELQVPILSKPTQQKIAELVRRSHEARKKAKNLLEEAKRKVEELIEQKNK
ncbi:restriction endonuclease subunit S [Candidatus Azambacteria bacterium]|nr:restriction endonuclease subunit S [Candidatus Azambacteria bacterium]